MKCVRQNTLTSTYLRQGYVFTGVCDSVHRGGVSQHALWQTPPFPRADTPRQTPPGRRPLDRHPPGRNPALDRQPPAQQTATAVDGTHPTGCVLVLKVFFQ